MLGRPICLAAYCALGASAFLLPPTVASDDDVPSFVPNLLLDMKSQILALPCSSCAFTDKDAVPVLAKKPVEDNMFWTQGGANNLVLNFTISEDGEGLLVNEHFIYHYGKLAVDKNVMEDMYVDQVSASFRSEDLYDHNYIAARLQVTGSALTEKETVQGASEDEIITLEWQLLSLEHETMTVDPVFIQLIRTDTGELLILSVLAMPAATTTDDTFPFPADSFIPVAPPSHPQPETKPRPCNMPGPFCAISDFVHSAFGSAHRKPCPGKFGGDHLPTHIRPHFGHAPFGSMDSESEDAEPEHQHFGPPHLNTVEWNKPWHPLPDSKPFDHPPHPGHRHGHGHGHHRHGFFHVISRGILAVLIPIMAGITVGIIVSVTGLLFGRFLGWLWFTVLRRDRRAYTWVALEEDDDDEEELISEHKDHFIAEDEEETLPLYEHAPPYEGRENTNS